MAFIKNWQHKNRRVVRFVYSVIHLQILLQFSEPFIFSAFSKNQCSS